MKGAAPRRPLTRSAITTSRRSAASATTWALWQKLGRVLGWALTFTAVGWGLQRLGAFVLAPRADIECRLEWQDLPPWLSATAGEPMLRQIQDAAGLTPGDDIHDPALCQRVAEGLLTSAWVAEVKRVTKHPDGRISVRAVYRDPFAFVEAGGVAYLVDRNGVRLPYQHDMAVIDARYPNLWNDWLLITGVSEPVPQVGRAWPGPDLAAGLRLVDYLKEATSRGEVPFRSSLRTVDVANYSQRKFQYEGRLRIGLIFAGYYIHWGLPPGEEAGIEPPASRKLQLLAYEYATHGQLPVNDLDVRYPEKARPGKPGLRH